MESEAVLDGVEKLDMAGMGEGLLDRVERSSFGIGGEELREDKESLEMAAYI